MKTLQFLFTFIFIRTQVFLKNDLKMFVKAIGTGFLLKLHLFRNIVRYWMRYVESLDSEMCGILTHANSVFPICTLIVLVFP
jgi:hypothetical protein